MSGYRDEERLRRVDERTAHAVALARARLPSVRTRGAARIASGGLGAVLGFALSTGALAAFTCLLFWPVAHLAMCRTLVGERLELDELRIALEGLGD